MLNKTHEEQIVGPLFGILGPFFPDFLLLHVPVEHEQKILNNIRKRYVFSVRLFSGGFLVI